MPRCRNCNREVEVKKDTDGELVHTCPVCGPVVVLDQSRYRGTAAIDFMVDRSTWK